ncbi:MAG TPA: hypothetical protein VMV31_05955 [Terriglobales bacterium]|nr:hypothetical protein [Terriglobales bacterium]
MFHALNGEIAETYSRGNQNVNALIYRAIEHGSARKRSDTLGRRLPRREADFFGRTEFSPPLQAFANTFVELQELRHSCDYDPRFRLNKVRAQGAVDDAEDAIASLRDANAGETFEFLAYVLFGLRS